MNKLEWIETIGGYYSDTVIGRYFIDVSRYGYYLTTRYQEIGLYETFDIADKVCQRFHDREMNKYNNQEE